MYKSINNALSTVATRWLQSGRYDDDYGRRFKGSEKRKRRINDRHFSTRTKTQEKRKNAIKYNKWITLDF